jgi:FecR protein
LSFFAFDFIRLHLRLIKNIQSHPLNVKATSHKENKMNIAQRRRWLKSLAALGLIGPAGVSGLIQEALAKGDTPTIAGINSLQGTATVNGTPARVGTPVKPGDRITTGAKSFAVVVVGKDAYLLRDNSTIVLEESKAKPGVLENVLILTGKVLSVLEKRPADQRVQYRTPNATIGIRGTGFYIEIEAGRTYFCLCYGEAAIDGKGMSAPKIINTVHHEQPLWLDDRGGTMKAEKGPFMNHVDDELIMLEKLVGREPPFVALGLTGRY